MTMSTNPLLKKEDEARNTARMTDPSVSGGCEAGGAETWSRSLCDEQVWQCPRDVRGGRHTDQWEDAVGGFRVTALILKSLSSASPGTFLRLLQWGELLENSAAIQVQFHWVWLAYLRFRSIYHPATKAADS